MIFKKELLAVLFILLKTISTDISNNEKIAVNSAEDAKPEYMGDKFPVKYLEIDHVIPTLNDLDYYLKSLKSTADYSSQNPNNTEVSKSLGFFFTKVILKRTVRDLSDRLSQVQQALIREIINQTEDVLSHHIYTVLDHGWNDTDYTFLKLLRDDTEQVYSMAKFNRNHLKQWIISKGNLNDYIKKLDEATLPKEEYARLIVETTNVYFTRIQDSDKCLSRIVYNPVPVDMGKLRPCLPDPFCRRCLHSSPSFAYTLSHRMLNLMMYRHSRRCYWVSEKDDAYHIDILCAFMYREAVYVARRGYFARDLFLEHVALCAMMGYEEFHRHNWFYKAASWIDNQGCITEDVNYTINSSKLFLDDEKDETTRQILREERDQELSSKCHGHPMALLMMVLAHGVRHAAHFMSVTQQ